MDTTQYEQKIAELEQTINKLNDKLKNKYLVDADMVRSSALKCYYKKRGPLKRDLPKEQKQKMNDIRYILKNSKLKEEEIKNKTDNEIKLLRDEIERNKRIEYYENNKEIYSKKIKCEVCGIEYPKYNKSKHLKSQSHIIFDDFRNILKKV